LNTDNRVVYFRFGNFCDASGLTMQPALTPVERGILFILMAQSQPVRQAGFKTAHGLTVRRTHRQKLQEQGLIEVSEAPLAFALTKRGWAWLSAETAAQKPEGVLGLGPLYAALSAIGQLAGRLGLPLDEALAPNGPPHDPPPTATGVRQPEWIEVDESLARALQDISVFSAALSRLRESAKGALEQEIKRAELSANLVFQNVRVAAKKRALDLDGAVGSEAPFDPVSFYSNEDIELGAPVRIRKSPVTRGQGKKKVIIQPGVAEAIHS
jgi:hypothetical protein